MHKKCLSKGAKELKYLMVWLILISLSSCAVNHNDKAVSIKENRDRADSAQRRAREHGDLPGTPENIEAGSSGDSLLNWLVNI